MKNDSLSMELSSFYGLIVGFIFLGVSFKFSLNLSTFKIVKEYKMPELNKYPLF